MQQSVLGSRQSVYPGPSSAAAASPARRPTPDTSLIWKERGTCTCHSGILPRLLFLGQQPTQQVVHTTLEPCQEQDRESKLKIIFSDFDFGLNKENVGLVEFPTVESSSCQDLMSCRQHFHVLSQAQASSRSF